MKEILFRGKRYSGEWVYGNLFIPDKEDAPTEIGIGTNVIRITYDVITETVGQYTGLKDKHGKRIFEGDIVLKRTYHGKKPMKVYYENGIFTCGEHRGSSVMERYYTLCDSQIEVIGNVYDNPELLEG